MPGTEPAKVREIVKALEKENPSWSEEKVWSIAWSTYNKMGGKGKDYAGMGGGYGAADDIAVTGMVPYPAEKGSTLKAKLKAERCSGKCSCKDAIEEDITPPVSAGTRTYDIVQWFRANPYPEDWQVHEYATEIGLSPEQMEKEIYRLLTDLLVSH